LTTAVNLFHIKIKREKSGELGGMLACPDPLKQNKKQQLSDKRAITLQHTLSLSGVRNL